MKPIVLNEPNSIEADWNFLSRIISLPQSYMTKLSQPSLISVVSRTNLDRRRIWSVFRVFNICRLILAAILVGVFVLGEQVPVFGQRHPSLFLFTALGYMAAVLLSIITSFWRRPSLQIQAHLQTLVDLTGLSLLIYASGGITSSLTILLVTAVAASGILLPLYSALTAAALAFFIMLGNWLYSAFLSFEPSIAALENALFPLGQFLGYLTTYNNEMDRLGLLGASFFIAALLTYTLAERARRSEKLAYQRSLELLEMAELNQAIVQHLPSGIIVVDRDSQIRLMNDKAKGLLDYSAACQGKALREISPTLEQRLHCWLNTGLPNTKPFRQAEHLPDIIPNFSHLQGNRSIDTLISLEDSAQASQRLHQIKLAALGRMTAGIAHEVRNPLASISHAAQLLQESTTASPNEQRLGQIIHDNTKRANRIITNVLDLSRRNNAKPEDFTLKPWLNAFVQEFCRGQGSKTPQLALELQVDALQVRFDPSHLHQVLWNLCSNACIHGTFAGQPPRLRVAVGLDTLYNMPYIDVHDFGQGIPESEVKKIFEPFFTTKAQGTGLGLYISREICEANGAQLQYLRPSEGGSCFRIMFAKPINQEKEPQWTLATP